jgi:thioredoxin-like negative regulator of GroEL
MMGAYEQYGQLAGPKVHVLRIDCSRFFNIADQQKIEGFPTVKLFQNGQATKEYTGDRKVGSFMVFQSGN